MAWPSSTEMVMRVLPVNSSAPVSTTMARPKGNNRPHTIRAAPTLAIEWAAVLVAVPPMAMKNPASTASRNIFGMGISVLARPAAA